MMPLFFKMVLDKRVYAYICMYAYIQHTEGSKSIKYVYNK